MADWTLMRPLWGVVWFAPLLLQLWHWHHQRSGQSFIHARLLGYLRQHQSQTHHRHLRWLWFPWSLLIVALMGPAQQQPSPLFQRDDVWIWMLDVSHSMQADDVAPTRLLQARYRLMELLGQAAGRRIALIAFAGDAYLITPPTDDRQTLSYMLRALNPDVMPVAGSAPESAVKLALALLARNGKAEGRLLLITDDLNPQQAHRISSLLHDTQQPLDVLSVGTEQGAAIPLGSGGLLRDRSGDVVISHTPRSQLAELAAANHGHYADSSQPAQLASLVSTHPQQSAHALGANNLQRDDLGYWVLFALLPCVLLFRRGWLFVCLLLPLAWPSSSAWADDLSGRQAYQQGHYLQAADAFTSPLWRGHALYRAGRYSEAIAAYRQAPVTADTLYNLGNAYAQQLAFDEAIAAYDEALLLAPEMQDARINRELVLSWMQQQNAAQQQPTTAPDTPHPADTTDLRMMAADPGNLMRNRLRLQQQHRLTREGRQTW